jgi:hypothetical protein
VTKVLIPTSMTKTFELSSLPNGWVKIKKARAGEELKLATLIVDAENQGKTVTVRDIQRVQMFLSFVDSNLACDVYENNNVVLDLTSDIDEIEFREIWNTLPLEVVEEWYKYVIEMNPQWGDVNGEHLHPTGGSG